jgi:AcrR family transcriptional regulator
MDVEPDDETRAISDGEVERPGVRTDAPWFARPEPKPPLRAGRIVEAAHALVHAGGREALSIRDLEQVLGVGASAIYRRVGNKDQLLIAVTDLVLSQAELPPDTMPWKDALWQLSLGLHDALEEHPHVHPILDSHVLATPATARLACCAMEILGRAGLQGDELVDAYNGWIGYVLGFSIVENLPTQPADERDQMRRWIHAYVDGLDPVAFPTMAAARTSVLNTTFGLRWDAGMFGAGGGSFPWGLAAVIDRIADRQRETG